MNNKRLFDLCNDLLQGLQERHAPTLNMGMSRVTGVNIRYSRHDASVRLGYSVQCVELLGHPLSEDVGERAIPVR